MQRREFVTALAATAAAGVAAGQTPQPMPHKGRLKQSVMRFNFDPKMPLEDMCREAARLGAKGFDFVSANDLPTLKKYGLIPTMMSGLPNFKDGIIHKEVHDKLEASFGPAIDAAAADGCPNVLAIGGQKQGMSYAEGADNAVTFFNRIKARAEDKNVTVCLEIMNSRLTPDTVGGIDQMCDHVAWAVDVVKRVNSPRIKVLFDIYHVQIMDGDIVRNIRNNIKYIAHFHTGGVPDRHEIDETQEINYRFVAQAIAELGFTGYIAHEYRPAPGRDPIKSLEQAIAIIDV